MWMACCRGKRDARVGVRKRFKKQSNAQNEKKFEKNSVPDHAEEKPVKTRDEQIDETEKTNPIRVVQSICPELPKVVSPSAALNQTGEPCSDITQTPTLNLTDKMPQISGKEAKYVTGDVERHEPNVDTEIMRDIIFKQRSLSAGHDGNPPENPADSLLRTVFPEKLHDVELKRSSRGGSFRNFVQLKSIQKHLPKRSFRQSIKRLSRPESGGSFTGEQNSGSLRKISPSSQKSHSQNNTDLFDTLQLGDHRPSQGPVKRSRMFHILTSNNDRRTGEPLSRMRFFRKVSQISSPRPIVSQSAHNNDPRRGSLTIYSHVDEPIVTPFAQVLAGLRRVRANFIALTNVTSSKDLHFGTTQSQGGGDERTPSAGHLSTCELPKSSASETLEELEWCLERLENIQTHRSVSDMASSKFRKLLSKELSQFADADRKGRQISEYLVSTFLDSKEGDTSGNSPSTHSVIKDVPTLNEADEFCLADISPTDQLGDKITGGGGGNQTTGTAGQPSDTTIVPTNKTVVESTAVNADATTAVNSDAHTIEFSAPHSPQLRTQKDVSGITEVYGAPSGDPVALNDLITESIDRWGMDIFDVSSLTSSPLVCLFNAIIQRRGLMKRFCLSEATLVRYMTGLEARYNDVPYHSRVHAADVLQSTHVLLNVPALTSIFTDLEVLAILFAAAVHDVGHPGVTNQFLINTNDRLAILYNDASVLENHHLAVAFSLLNEPGMDLFENLQKKQRLTLRRMVIDMVLATDMSKHMSLLADLKTMVETKKVAGSGILTLDNYSDRMQILQNMLHCADLSNPTKPLEIYRQWNSRVMEEHFRQGDQERKLGHDLSPMCDRETASVEKTQVTFIDYIIHPLWETWSDLVHPDAQRILDTLEENREWYRSQIVDEDAVLPEGQEEDDDEEETGGDK